MTKAPAVLKTFLFSKTEGEEPDVDIAIQPKLQAKCINCGRPLKAQKSVDRGIGPICAKKNAPSGG